jgi:hypothetical protein
MTTTFDRTSNYQSITVVDLMTAGHVVTGTVDLVAGTVTDPSLSVTGVPGAGIYLSAPGVISFTSDGVNVASFSSAEGVQLYNDLNLGGNAILNLNQNGDAQSVSLKAFQDSTGSIGWNYGQTGAQQTVIEPSSSPFPKVAGTATDYSNTPSDWQLQPVNTLTYVNPIVGKSVVAVGSISGLVAQNVFNPLQSVYLGIFKNGVLIPQSLQYWQLDSTVSFGVITLTTNVPVSMVLGDSLDIRVDSNFYAGFYCDYMSLTCK